MATEIVLATRNRNKVEEIRKMLNDGSHKIRILTPDDFPQSQEVHEDCKTFEENAIKKAAYFHELTGSTSVADDSGLEVEALDGAPGVLSARYAGESADDTMNNRKLLEEMKNVPSGRRGAQFVCCIAVASEEGITSFTGRVHGWIGTEERGREGFGYDPLFYPDGSDRTFAEMSDVEKNAVSHRAVALHKLKAYLLKKC